MQPGSPPRPGSRPQIGIGGCRIGPRAKALVAEVLDSNRLSAGPVTARFEHEVAALHGARYGLFCNSGTSALQIALAALKERDGWADADEVLVPAVTFISTSNVVLYNGLRPVFVEVEPETYCIDPARIEGRITARTRAIMPVHVGGLPCEMDKVMEIARRRKLRVVEDCAEAMFARYKGAPVGSFSDVACFSTYVAHMISTGVGGLCTTDDADLMVMLKSLMNHGRDSIYTRIDDDQGMEGRRLFEVAARRFSFVRLGHSFRCTEMEAALGLAELEQREANCARRRAIAARYDAGLADLKDRLQLPRTRPGAEHVFMFYPVTVTDPRTTRDAIVAWLEDRAIETRYVLPLINQPVYRRIFGDIEKDYPVAARINRSSFYVGCHPEMSDDDVEYVIEAFHAFFREKR
jgi:dTDP-4-amino-4,6-dideoxygalactose transaminase